MHSERGLKGWASLLNLGYRETRQIEDICRPALEIDEP